MECSNAARALCVDSSSYSRLFAVAGNRKEEGEQHLSAGGCIPWCGCWWYLWCSAVARQETGTEARSAVL